MTNNQAHELQKDHPNSSVRLVTQAEFETVDLEAPIHNSGTVDYLGLAAVYEAAYSQHEQTGNETAARVFKFVFQVLFMHFKPEDTAEPYGPCMQMNGRRSMIPSDLRGKQSDILAAIAAKIRNPGLRSRLADVAWLNNRKPDIAQLAINAYCDSVQAVLDGTATFDLEQQTSSSSSGTKMLHRACQIANMIGWKDSEVSRLKPLILDATQDAFDRKDHSGFTRAANLNLQFSIGEAEALASKAETLAGDETTAAFGSHDLWKFAASAHHRSKNDAERDRCLKSAAECYVALADAYDGKGMVATKHLMDAIQELRRIPNTKERRQQIEARLREVQSSISDEMNTITTEVDLTESAEEARKRVSGLSLAQALKIFACLDRSPDPEVLREQARKQAKEHIFTSTSLLSIVDDEGKVTAKSPGFFSNTEDNNTRLHHIIVQHETLRIQLTATSLINPARLQIYAEHLLEPCDFFYLASSSPFIPGDRVNLFSLAFARFFGGDFLSALHILVPQLENSLRYVLKQAGKETSWIRNNMTQEDVTLSNLLKNDRQSLEDIFGPAIVYEIENLFDFSGGSKIRHRLAHGLISDQERYAEGGIYACWFIFHICCLPLLRHWDRLADYMEGNQA